MSLSVDSVPLILQWALQGMLCHITWALKLTVSFVQNLAPTYEQLGDAFAHAKDKVYIAKMDADGVGKDIAQKYGVTGYPSKFHPGHFNSTTCLLTLLCLALKWFSADGKDEPFEGSRDIDGLAGL
jgi:protein disulfide-isomerase A6